MPLLFPGLVAFGLPLPPFPREPVLALVLGWDSGALEEGVKVFCSKGQWYKHWTGVWLQRTFSLACSSNISTTPSEFSKENSSQRKCHYQLLVCGHKNSVSPFFFKELVFSYFLGISVSIICLLHGLHLLSCITRLGGLKREELGLVSFLWN